MDKWLETAKSELYDKLDAAKYEIKTKLETMCNGLENKLLKTVGELETRVEQLEGENGILKQQLDAMEKYDRGDSLEIHNVPVTTTENAEEIVIAIASEMGIELAPSDISTAYRLPQKKEKVGKTTPRLYVKFTRRSMKKLIYSTRSKKKVTHQQLGIGTNGKIYIHEHLSKSQLDLYYKTKDKVKDLGYKFLWTQDLNIYVRHNEKAKRIIINNETDLDNLQEVPPTQQQVPPTLRSSSTLNSTSTAAA